MRETVAIRHTRDELERQAVSSYCDQCTITWPFSLSPPFLHPSLLSPLLPPSPSPPFGPGGEELLAAVLLTDPDKKTHVTQWGDEHVLLDSTSEGMVVGWDDARFTRLLRRRWAVPCLTRKLIESHKPAFLSLASLVGFVMVLVWSWAMQRRRRRQVRQLQAIVMDMLAESGLVPPEHIRDEILQVRSSETWR